MAECNGVGLGCQICRVTLLAARDAHTCIMLWLPLPRRWFFVAGEKEAITSKVTSITKDIGLDL